MKQAIKALTFTAVLAIAAWLAWFFGIVFEFEYPYTLTLVSVQSAKSVNGVPVSGIIKSDGAQWPPGLHWHTCSYCANSCGRVKGLICVQVSAPDNSTIYHFAYSRETHTLVPLTSRTAAHYPTLMPTNDPVRIVQQMNGNTGAYGNGYGEFELPEKWFRKVTHTEPGGAANRSQPVALETNRTSSAAGSRR
jgi:hypothetical protein